MTLSTESGAEALRHRVKLSCPLHSRPVCLYTSMFLFVSFPVPICLSPIPYFPVSVCPSVFVRPPLCLHALLLSVSLFLSFSLFPCLPLSLVSVSSSVAQFLLPQVKSISYHPHFLYFIPNFIIVTSWKTYKVFPHDLN